MAQNRYPAFPSRMTLQQFKTRTKGAKKGHSLLKRKSDALKARLQGVLKEIYDVKLQLNEVMAKAAFSHTEAQHAAGEFNNKVIAKTESATTVVACRSENVVGVKILQFDKVENGSNDESMLGLARGGTQIRKCQKSYQDALELLIKLASLQTSFRELDEAMKVTNRRVNALDNVVIPKLENTMHYIASELDERDREDLFRLKKVVAKKKEEAEIADALRRAAEEHEKDTHVTVSSSMTGEIYDDKKNPMVPTLGDDDQDPDNDVAGLF